MLFPFILILITIFIIGGVIFAIVFFVWKSSQRRKEKIKLLGRRLGFQLVSSDSFWTSPKFRGHYNGKWDTEIMEFARSQGEGSVQTIKFVMVYTPKSTRFPKKSFWSRKSVLSVTEHIFFGSKVPHASSEYNKAFSTKGTLVRELVNPDFQHRMLELKKTAHCELHVYPPLSNKDGTIEFMTTRKFITDVHFAEKVLELMGSVAEKMEALQLKTY